MTADTSPGYGAWLRRYRRLPEARARLVCFPHAGGAASFFRMWARRSPPEVEVLVVQYPGREDRLRERLCDDMATLADAVAEAMRPELDRPVGLFGHSMGATVAYEVARRLDAAPSAGLFVSGRPAPHRQRPGALHLRDDDALIAELRRLGGPSDVVLDNPELRDLYLPALRNDYRVVETYRPEPGPPLSVPVTAYIGDRDPEVTPEEARGWADVTDGGFKLRIFPGDHFYLVPHRADVLGAVLRELGVRTEGGPWPSTP